jgi:hypothetical protein
LGDEGERRERMSKGKKKNLKKKILKGARVSKPFILKYPLEG